jgi:hypothetical protein
MTSQAKINALFSLKTREDASTFSDYLKEKYSYLMGDTPNMIFNIKYESRINSYFGSPPTKEEFTYFAIKHIHPSFS